MKKFRHFLLLAAVIPDVGTIPTTEDDFNGGKKMITYTEMY